MKRNYAHTMRAVLARVLVLAMVMMAFAVVTPKATALAAAKPALTKTSSNIIEGKNYDLDVKNAPAGATYVWKTSNKKVATVDKNGVVVAKGKGKSTITCTVTDSKKKTYKLTCKVTVIKPAKSLKIANPATVLNLGQKYDLNTSIIPAASNDVVSWTSSDKTIAAPDKNGKFTAKKKGTVTITAKALSGKKASVTIEVVDAEGLVTDQAGLDKLIGSGAAVVTLKTDAEKEFVVAAGDYTNQKLVVDAPKADVVVNGDLNTIDVLNIKPNTMRVTGHVQTINIGAPSGHIVLAPSARVADLYIVHPGIIQVTNNGSLNNINLNAGGTFTLDGTPVAPPSVLVNASGINMTSSQPVNMICNQVIALTLNAGAEGTTVRAASQDLVPTITGTVSATITVGPIDGSKPGEVIVRNPAAGPTQGGPAPSSPSGPSTPATPNNGYAVKNGNTYTLGGDIAAVKGIRVEYGALSWNITGAMLDKLRAYLANDTAAINTWKSITNSTNNDFEGYTVTVTGTAGSMNKSVTLNISGLNKTYNVSVNGGTVTVGNYTITKSDNNRSLTITNAPENLKFYITY